MSAALARALRRGPVADIALAVLAGAIGAIIGSLVLGGAP
jgi:hypothetical protein